MQFDNKPFSKISINNISYLLIGYIIFSVICLISPLSYTVGLNGTKFILSSTLVILYVLHYRNRTIYLPILVFSLFIIFLSSLSGIYWENWTVAFFPMLFVSSLILASFLNLEELKIVVSISTKILFIILFGAWLAFVFSYLGFDYIAQYETVSGRLLNVFFLSLGEFSISGAGSSYVTIFRPSGIYDEPGALSMVITIIAAMRHMLNMNKRTTWKLLLLGFITFSLAHLIYVIIHFFSEGNFRKKLKNLLIIVSISVLLSLSTGTFEIIERGLLNRIIIFDNDTITLRLNNNRTKYFNESVEEIKLRNLEKILFSPEANCFTGGECKDGRIDFTLLSPLLIQGFLLSWYYYVILGLLLFLGIKQTKNLVLIGVVLLFIQRPSMHSIGYSMLIALVVVMLFKLKLLNFRLYTSQKDKENDKLLLVKNT